jgi:hypothetical protein
MSDLKMSRHIVGLPYMARSGSRPTSPTAGLPAALVVSLRACAEAAKGERLGRTHSQEEKELLAGISKKEVF